MKDCRKYAPQEALVIQRFMNTNLASKVRAMLPLRVPMQDEAWRLGRTSILLRVSTESQSALLQDVRTAVSFVISHGSLHFTSRR